MSWNPISDERWKQHRKVLCWFVRDDGHKDCCIFWTERITKEHMKDYRVTHWAVLLGDPESEAGK